MAQMPPSESDLSARDLWAQITAIPRPHRIVDFPRNGPDGKPIAQFAMMVLTQDESMLATASTERWVKKLLKDNGCLPGKDEVSGGYHVLFENRASLEILFRSAKRIDDLSKPFFPTVDTIGARLTTDEIGVLMTSYLHVQSQLGPILSEMGQDEVDAWIERLAKGGSSNPLPFLSLGALSHLVTSMASRLWSSQMASGSPGGQPVAPT
jgi:hypothetical protein